MVVVSFYATVSNI